MLSFEPLPPPAVGNEDARRVAAWAFEMFMALRTIESQRLHLELQTEAPASPAVGDVFFADGTNWNPGGGAGLYEYTGAGTNGFRMLASGVQY